MNKDILWSKINAGLENKIESFSIEEKLLLYLIKTVLYNDPTKYCEIRGHRRDWDGLPATKSLFFAAPYCGLPIGNLTSQLFGNIYLNEFDHYVKQELGIKYYGRYVDDIILIHPSRHHLLYCIIKMKDYLTTHLHLELHPNKIYLQHYSKGVKYLGTVIKPHRIYIGNRSKGNLHALIIEMNVIEHISITKKLAEQYVARLNSYLGCMKRYKSHRLRRKLLVELLDMKWRKYLIIASPYKKVEICKSSFMPAPTSIQSTKDG